MLSNTYQQAKQYIIIDHSYTIRAKYVNIINNSWSFRQSIWKLLAGLDEYIKDAIDIAIKVPFRQYLILVK